MGNPAFKLSFRGGKCAGIGIERNVAGKPGVIKTWGREDDQRGGGDVTSKIFAA